MVPVQEVSPAPMEFEEGDHPDLRSSDIEVLRSLGQEEALAFQGLKRKMHIHQEKLSRALQRLEQIGLVAKTDKGYVLTAKGIEMAQLWPVEAPKGHEVILQSFLPCGVHPRLIANQLEGRWFGNLRWLGTREGAEETVLRWVTYDTEVEVDLRIRWGEIIVDTDAQDRDGRIDAFLAAQLIYAQLRGPWNESWNPAKAPIMT